MFNMTAPDIIQYLNADYKRVIQETVVEKMNLAFFSMANKHRNYSGKVSIVAHSLGTVVSYDILCHQTLGIPKIELGFQAESLFILGSPLGLFTSVYSKENFIRSVIPRCKRIYNVYHPSDLIAFRIEPLIKNSVYDIDPEEIKPPVLVPCYWNTGFNQTQ